MMSAPDNGVQVYMQYFTDNPHNMQFRMRVIERNKLLPVTLYSIDYRGYMTCVIDGKQYVFKHEVPIVDVVIEHNKNNALREDIVTMTKTNIPVASLKFLLKDLIKTYNNEELAGMRVWNNKKQKDADRFKKLRELYMQRLQKTGEDASRSKSGSPSIMGTKVRLDAVDELYTNFVASSDVSWYIKMFDDIRNKEKKQVKHKMPFDFEKIMTQLDIRRDLPPPSKSESESSPQERSARRVRVRRTQPENRDNLITRMSRLRIADD
jgi:hypothetical protein